MLIDSHCHLDDYTDLPDVLARAKAAGVDTLLAIGIGNGPGDMHRALEIAEQFGGSRQCSGAAPKIYATVGIHPQEAHQATPEALKMLRNLAAHPLCLAVGEIGLDYYHAGNPEPEIQKQAFVAQLQLAAELRKPITIHCRTSELASSAAKAKFGGADAWQDLLDVLGKHWTSASHEPGKAGIMHCFSGDAGQAQQSMEAGFFLSFAGNLTYPKSVALQEIARAAPAGRLLIETDAPFLTPAPRRGERNEPAHVALTAGFLAQLRGTSPEEIGRLTTANFLTLFPSAA